MLHLSMYLGTHRLSACYSLQRASPLAHPPHHTHTVIQSGLYPAHSSGTLSHSHSHSLVLVHYTQNKGIYLDKQHVCFLYSLYKKDIMYFL